MQRSFFKINNNLLQYSNYSYSNDCGEFILKINLDNIRTHIIKLLDKKEIFLNLFNEYTKDKWNDGSMFTDDYVNYRKNNYKLNDIIREEPIKTIVGNGFLKYIYDLDKLKLEVNISDDFKIITC